MSAPDPLLDMRVEWQRLTQEIRAAEARSEGLPYGPASKAIEAELNALDRRRDALAVSMAKMPARTCAGAVAKVLVAGAWLARAYLPGSGIDLDIEEQLIVSAASDFDRLGEGGAA